jgi:hypothetical protein
MSAKNIKIISEGTAAIHRQNVEVKTATIKNVERKNAEWDKRSKVKNVNWDKTTKSIKRQLDKT